MKKWQGKPSPPRVMACELSFWSEPGYLDTLAATYAEAGNFTEAIKWAEEAV